MTGPIGRPHLADANDLERWADRTPSRHELARLVRRLIRAENDQVQRVEMPAGEGVDLPGYDGLVDATRGTSFVPDGRSVWEMGVARDPQAKANADYRKRTRTPLHVDPASTTFVFVTPRRWNDKKAWEDRRRAEGKWRDVRVLDAEDIEQALEEAPAVHFWLSELLEMPAAGVQTMEDWWKRFSTLTDPPLTPRMVLAGRADEASALLRLLAADVGHTSVKAPSVDDGLAFVVSAMLSSSHGGGDGLISRSLLVHDGISLRRLDSTSSLLILLPYEENLIRQARLIGNHHVVFIVTDESDAAITLPPLPHAAFEAELRENGVAEPDLSRMVRAAHKSLLAFQRVASRNGFAQTPHWVEELQSRTLRRAWLAGAWSARRSGDTEVLGHLTREDYADVDERLLVAARQPDPLFTRVGPTWAVASPSDSWPASRQSITEADLAALEKAVQTVLSAVDPRLELPVEERWLAAIHGKTRVHSTDLRRGLATTLALLGARGDELRLPSGRTGRLWAESAAAQLFERANSDSTAQLWVSLEDVLPLLAEAAPDVFLRAVATGTQGPDPLLRQMFQDEPSGISVSSPHTGLLWALEAVAWSPTYLGLATDLLARLAELDPGGRLSNRPISSMEEIYKAWRPQTTATAQTRLATLDALLNRHADAGWDVLVALLPETGGFGMPTQEPLFRDWKPQEVPDVTWPEYMAFGEAIADRLLAVARQHPQRWIALTREFHRLPSAKQSDALSSLAAVDPESLMPADRLALWEALEAVVRHHREYSDSDWSLPEALLSELDAVATRMQPSSASETHKWLFDEWRPDIGDGRKRESRSYEAALSGARAAAASEILETEGLSGLTDLAKRVQLPWSVGWALAEVSEAHDQPVLDLLDSEDQRLEQFADSLVRARVRVDPNWLEPWVERFAGRPLLQARLMQSSANLASAWRTIDALDPEIGALYWKEFSPNGRGQDFPELTEAAIRLVQHNRSAVAVHALSMYADRLSGDSDAAAALAALNALGTDDDPELERVSEYDLGRLIEFLHKSGAPEDLLAGLEWRFLPLLRLDAGGAPHIEHRLARDPAFFVEVLSLCFRPASDKKEPGETGTPPHVAKNAYKVLREWHLVPGSTEDGRVDATALEAWLQEARRLLAARDRVRIGELQIGEVLAYAPIDADGTYPARPVRDALESAPDDALARGFSIGVVNKRGVTSRGLTEGGQQEYKLAGQYDAWAAAIATEHPRTAAVLRSIAEDYRAEALRNDEEAKRFLEGLGP